MGVKQNNEEPIEGLDKAEDAAWGDYPIDTVLIRNETRTVFDILRRIEKGSFIMNPDFQRDFIWKEEMQSKLIESVLMRIPLPVFYLAEDEQGRMIVVDGLQRLSTFQHFHNDKLHLKLPKQKELDGKCFADLSPKLQNRVEDCNLTLYIIDAKVPEQARLDIFERVNSGIALTRQQMRNCLYMGAATRFLREESRMDIFRKATGNSLNTSTMRDREFINRFCAFQLLTLDDYKGDMDDFLAQALKAMNQLDSQAITQLSTQFRLSMSNNFNLFGKHAFRKHTDPMQSRSVLNASLWDVMSTALSRYSEPMVEGKADELRIIFNALMKDNDFMDSITYATNNVQKVQHRFIVFNNILREVFNAHSA